MSHSMSFFLEHLFYQNIIIYFYKQAIKQYTNETGIKRRK